MHFVEQSLGLLPARGLQTGFEPAGQIRQLESAKSSPYGSHLESIGSSSTSLSGRFFPNEGINIHEHGVRSRHGRASQVTEQPASSHSSLLYTGSSQASSLTPSSSGPLMSSSDSSRSCGANSSDLAFSRASHQFHPSHAKSVTRDSAGPTRSASLSSSESRGPAGPRGPKVTGEDARPVHHVKPRYESSFQGRHKGGHSAKQRLASSGPVEGHKHRKPVAPVVQSSVPLPAPNDGVQRDTVSRQVPRPGKPPSRFDPFKAGSVNSLKT